MKRVLLAVVAAVSMTSLAQAGFDSTVEPWENQGGVYLECVPPLDRRDSNPTVRIRVSIIFKQTTPGAPAGQDYTTEPKSMEVFHELYDTTLIDRTEQYKGGKMWTVPNRYDWYWSGALAKIPSVTMVGRVTRDVTGKWTYTENQFKNGDANWPKPITSRCRIANDAD